MAWDLSGLTAYVEECDVPIIRKTIFSDSPVIDQFPNWMTGIKTCATIGILGVDANLGECECGFTDNTDVEINKREICVECIQVMGQLCDLDLQDYFTSKFVRRTAGAENISDELYSEFIDSFLQDIRKKTDILIFQGDKDSANGNLNRLDGLLKIIDKDTPDENKFTIDTTVAANAMGAAMFLSTKITGAMRNRGNLAALVDPQIQYSLAMAAYNACPCQPGETMENYSILPNGLKIIPAEGLRGTGQMIICPLDIIVVGTDFANDRETFKFWFSDDNQVWRYIVKFYIGIQIAIPSEVIIATLAPEVISSTSMGVVTVQNL